MTKQNDGAIWHNGFALSLDIGGKKYELKKVTDKTSDNFPDWKGDNVAGWERTSKSGVDYLALDIDKEKYVAFKNKYKKEDKHPDYNVLKSTPFKNEK